MSDLEFSKEYARKLLRPRARSPASTTQRKENQNKGEEAEKIEQSCFKKMLNYIYIDDEDFRLTTMVVCTNTVAIVLLYYLVCTLAFRYTTRATWPVKLLKSYVQSSAKIGK